MSQAKKILTNYAPEELAECFESYGEKSSRAAAVCKQVYQHLCDEPSAMADIAKSARLMLAQEFTVPALRIISEQRSEDHTVKYVLGLPDGERIETVLIPDVGRKAGKQTLCVSTQVGCAMGCVFCLTGRTGLKRNLETWEIVEQYRLAARQSKRPITHIVFMGMGEPLHNFKNLKKALRILSATCGANVSARRITVSTSGLLPQLEELSREFDVRLAITLSAPNDGIRSNLMPVNRSYSFDELLACVGKISRRKKDKVFLEYVMLSGLNDSDEHARELAQKLRGLPCKVNLIPFNEMAGFSFQRSEKSRLFSFLNILKDNGISVSIRQTRGQKIMAACGQLSAIAKTEEHGALF